MNKREPTELTLLAALWGASSLFMRLGAADFGPVVLAFVRAAGAALLLLPLRCCCWCAVSGRRCSSTGVQSRLWAW